MGGLLACIIRRQLAHSHVFFRKYEVQSCLNLKEKPQILLTKGVGYIKWREDSHL